MAGGRLTSSQLLNGLRETVQRAAVTAETEITLIGGAAAVLTGILPPSRVTGDLDVVAAAPAEQWKRLVTCAKQVGVERGLPSRWLNDDGELLFSPGPPAGWRGRRTLLETVGRVRVFAIGRVDWVALKALAAADRDVDVDDLQAAGVTEAEVEHARAYLAGFEHAGPILASKAQAAMLVLEALRGGPT